MHIMKSILFGSIGSVVESSEIQRQAFNEAFKEFGVDWYWNVANYIKMLQKPGGLNRLIEYSKNEINCFSSPPRTIASLCYQIQTQCCSAAMELKASSPSNH